MLSDEREWLRSQKPPLIIMSSPIVPDGMWVWTRDHEPVGWIDRDHRRLWASVGLEAERPEGSNGILLSPRDYLSARDDEGIRAGGHVCFR